MFELVDIEDHIPLPAPTFPKDLAAFPLCSTSSSTAFPLTSSLTSTSKIVGTDSSDAGASNNTNNINNNDTVNNNALNETRSRFRHALLSAIAAKFLFRVVPDVGFAVSIASLLQVADDVHLLPGQSKVWVHCTFTLVVFRPQVGDRLRARIIEQDPIMGIRLSVEFFDNIIVPPSRLVEGSEWEPTISQWGIRDETGAFVRYVNNAVVPTKKNQNENNKNDVAGDGEDAALSASNNNGGDEEDDEPEARSPTAHIPELVLAQHQQQQEQQQKQQQMMNTKTANSSLHLAPPPGSVICVIEKVHVTTLSEEQQFQQMNANSAAVVVVGGVGGLNNNASNSAMKIFGSFSACDGLGPEAWFEDTSH